MKNGYKSYLKFFVSYITAALIPIICICIIQYSVSNRISQSSTASYSESISHTVKQLDIIFGDIEKLGECIILEPDARSFASISQLEKKDISNIYTWKDTFRKYSLVSSYAKNVYLYSLKNTWLINYTYAVKLDDTMFGATLNSLAQDKREWLEFVNSCTINDFYITPSNEIVLLYNIPSTSSNRTILVIQIDKSKIADIIRPICLEGGTIVLYDNNSHPVLTFNGDTIGETASNESSSGMLTFSESIFKNWSIVSHQSKSVICKDTEIMRQYLLTITIITLFICLIVCYLLSKNNAAPLRKLISSMTSQIPKEYLDNSTNFLFVENTIATLLEKEEHFRSLNREQQELLHFEMVRCLMLGEYWDSDKLLPLLDHSKFTISGSCFGVITIVPQKNYDVKETSPLIKEAFEPYSASILSFTDHYAALFFLKQGTTVDDWNHIAHSIAYKLNHSVDAGYRLCVSNLYDSFEHIHIAYNETLALMEVQKNDENSDSIELFYSNTMPCVSETYYDYPIETEFQIISALKARNVQLISTILSDLWARNCVHKKLSVFMEKQLIRAMCNTMIRGLSDVLHDPQIDYEIKLMCNEHTLEGLFQSIEHLCTNLEDPDVKPISSSDIKLEDEIYAYLSANFADSNLTLDKLANDLKLSKRYLYDFICDHFHSSFAKLLEGLRITKACSLLRSSDNSISCVGEQVGYTNSKTFRLAFKRVMNVTPSDFVSAIETAKQSSWKE